MKRYHPADEVDFVIVGSGAAGGVMARELSQAGFSVVVLEQGPWLTTSDFRHDEIFVNDRSGLTNDQELQPNTFRESESETARRRAWAWYGRVVGGGSVHFTANYWRFPELEFEQASRFGVPDGSSVADWPITYAELEVFQRAKAVVLSANGVETTKLLLMSASSTFPQGLANSSGEVGRNIMFNGGGGAVAIFEHEINGWKGAVVSRVTWDQFLLPKETGLYGGGGFDIRADTTPIGAARRAPGGWGREWKQALRKTMANTALAAGHTTQLPVHSNRVDLDPTLKDAWGLPAPRLTFKEHPNDTKMQEWFGERGRDLMEAAGAQKVLWSGGGPSRAGPHLLGTCRMGKDPKSSVVNADHRAHDVPNLFIVDGSSFVTSGRGQPTMTIQALAFRAAEHITKLIKSGALQG